MSSLEEVDTTNTIAAAATTPFVEAPPSLTSTILSRGMGEDEDVFFELVTNDGSERSAELLIALKCIVSRQLPKMPREYIVRLVFDVRHTSLLLLRRPSSSSAGSCLASSVIGGVCYRSYPEQRFLEIAFLAVSGTEQVRGYGTRLMARLKHLAASAHIESFLTYADNYAIGYFQKQGFSKHVSLAKERWVGYIKDYDGGTLMECYVHPNYDYITATAAAAKTTKETLSITEKQRRFVNFLVGLSKTSQVVHPGINIESKKRILSALEIPGVSEAGWGASKQFRNATERDRHAVVARFNNNLLNNNNKMIQTRLTALQNKTLKGDEELTIVDTIINNIKDGDYYRNKDMLLADWRTLIASINNNVDSYGTALAEDIVTQLDKLINDMFPNTAKDTD